MPKIFGIWSNISPKLLELETSNLVHGFVWRMTKRRKKISHKSGRGLGHVTPTIFGITVGYPSDSLASCSFFFLFLFVFVKLYTLRFPVHVKLFLSYCVVTLGWLQGFASICETDNMLLQSDPICQTLKCHMIGQHGVGWQSFHTGLVTC